jgi:hypothetical protein
LHRVGAIVQRLGDNVSSGINNIGVVTGPASQRVVASPAVERVIAIAASQQVRACWLFCVWGGFLVPLMSDPRDALRTYAIAHRTHSFGQRLASSPLCSSGRWMI